MAYFDGLIETILSVGLVKPKQGKYIYKTPMHNQHFLFYQIFVNVFYLFYFSPPGILQPHIHYLLVLATSVDVVILGLSFPKGQAGESPTLQPHNIGVHTYGSLEA